MALIEKRSEGQQGQEVGRCGDKRDSSRDKAADYQNCPEESALRYRNPEGEREKGKAAFCTTRSSNNEWDYCPWPKVTSLYLFRFLP